MSLIDPQLKINDSGISVIKTIFNINEQNISRKHIEKNISIEEKGTRLNDIEDFFNKNGYIAKNQLLDFNFILGNEKTLQKLFPFIIPIKNKKGQHYVVVNGLKNNKLKILDPAKGSQYYLSIPELKKISFYSKSLWDLADVDQKINAICNQELSKYNLNISEILLRNRPTNLYNKLNYFIYLNENFGFKNEIAEKQFLIDLLKNQQISIVPEQFQTLKVNNNQIENTAPTILTVKNQRLQVPLIFPTDTNKNLYWQLFKQLGGFKKLWYIYIFAAVFSATTAQFSVFINQILIDNVLPTYNVNMVVLFAIGLGVYKIFDLATTIYKNFVGMHLGNILDKYFLYSFDKKMNNASLSYVHSYKKGDLMERVSDALKLKTFFMKFFTGFLVDTFVSLYSLCILFYINKMLTLIVVIVMILFLLWFKFITPYLKQNERIRYMRKADFLSKMMEKIEGIQVIKSFKIERFHSSKIFSSVSDYLKIQLKNGYIDLINKVVVSLIITISSVFIIAFLTKSAIEDQLITLGQIITFIALSSKIFSSLKGILEDNLTLQENEVILKRYLDFDDESKKTSKKGIQEFEIEKIEIQNLNYGYLPNELILKNINLSILKGEKIKIEGQNGSGKSTFSKVLTTLYKPESGNILINDLDRKFYSDDVMRDKILLVTNEDILFNDTIYNNISLGKPIEASEILKVSMEINFYDFIASKSEGLDFLINENGKNLSTGQRKKILLLRAVFANSEIIILDEVLSGIDTETRDKIESLIDSIKSKTVIIISHEPIHNIIFSKKYKITNGQLLLL